LKGGCGDGAIADLRGGRGDGAIKHLRAAAAEERLQI